MMIEIESEPFRVLCTDSSNKPNIVKDSEWLHTNDEYIVVRSFRHSHCGALYYELYVDGRVQNKVFSACRFKRNDIYSVN